MPIELNVDSKTSNTKKDKITLISFLKQYIKDNPDKIVIATMNVYRVLLNQLQEFDKKEITLEDVNVEYVNRFYNYCVHLGQKSNTIKTRFNKLKRIMGLAIERGLVKEYPFGKGKLVIPKSKSEKRKYLTSDEVEKLLKYIPTNHSEANVMSIVRFKLHVGLRIGDVFTQRKHNIVVQQGKDNEMIFKLHKSTSKTGSDIHLRLTHQAKQ